jgi:6-phosphogluconolactonase (cycloisomerase 2 family)
MNKQCKSRAGAAASVLALALIGGSASATSVYTETNNAGGNAVQIFRAGVGGALSPAGMVSTGGLGTSAGLGNQGALALSSDGRWLIAVNAGSNDISTFAVGANTVTLVDRVPSGGTMPVSVTLHNNLLYVLNAGGSGNIVGFRVTANGHLSSIAGSTRPLSSTTAGAAQVSFDNEGETLVVTEKGTNRISLYTLEQGRAVGPTPFPSNGMTPFGFAFDRRDTLLVSEAFGGRANASALSSYDIADEGSTLNLIDGSVPTAQTAACWVIVARHGRYAYTTNTGSGSVTGFRVGRTGSLSRLSVDGRTGITGGGPTDGATTPDGRMLFVLSPSIGEIVSFQVQADGTLRNLSSVAGAAGTATGLVAW